MRKVRASMPRMSPWHALQLSMPLNMVSVMVFFVNLCFPQGGYSSGGLNLSGFNLSFRE
jgi:hypothetical protein